jgi:hypothetical protein
MGEGRQSRGTRTGVVPGRISGATKSLSVAAPASPTALATNIANLTVRI